MSRTNETWFGFNLTQKQAVRIFIIALMAVLLLSYMLVSLFYTYLINFIINPFIEGYMLTIILNLLPTFVLMLVFLAISVYTLIKMRKIGKYYSQITTNSSTN